MTAARETELETENRMLREQVACLERVIGQLSPGAPVCYPAPGYWHPSGYWYWPNYQVTSGVMTTSVASGGVTVSTLSSGETPGNQGTLG